MAERQPVSSTPHPAPVDAVRGRVRRLQEALERMEAQRNELQRRRRRDMLTIGVGISVVLHLLLMFYLASHYRLRPGSRGPQPVSYEFAILQEEELTELDIAELDDLLPEVVSETTDSAPDAAELDPAVPAAELEIARAGSLPTLGGSGDGGVGVGGGLSGGGAGATFFGVSSRGMRFAFIVDRSGSMGQGPKMRVAMRELARSVDSLPDYASFYVVLFSSDLVQPPFQRGWMRAKETTVNNFIRWLNDIDPGGGTVPMPAFYDVFAIEERPDVIFFLTDGEIPADTAELVAGLNRRGGRVVINTIAFGEAQSQSLLKQIARESGGMYRYVAQGSGP